MDDATVRAPGVRRWATARQWLGVEMDEADSAELAASSAGAALAMLAIFGVSHHLLGLQGAVMLVASMAASAVLIFVTPAASSPSRGLSWSARSPPPSSA